MERQVRDIGDDHDGDVGFGVYIHWPFCASKCPYCDFNSHVRSGGIDQQRFLDAYRGELRATRDRIGARRVRQHILRRRHALTDVGGDGFRTAGRDRRQLAHRRQCRDHARSQSVERRGRPLPRLPVRRRQSRVARRAGAQRRRPEGTRPSALGRGGPRRRRCRTRGIRSLHVRSHLRAAAPEASANGAPSCARRSTWPAIICRSTSSPSSPTRRSRRCTGRQAQPARARACR